MFWLRWELLGDRLDWDYALCSPDLNDFPIVFLR